MTRMQKLFSGLGVGVALAMGSMNPASAIDIPFDPDGLGPLTRLGNSSALPTGLLAGLDWSVGNALAVGSVPLTVGAEFTVHYQAKLATFDLGGGNSGFSETNFNSAGAGTGQTISGIAPDFEWTVNARFRERVVSITGAFPNATAVFEVIADPGNYLKVFYDGTANVANGGVAAGPNASTALGTGHIDGVEILSGTIVVGNSSSITLNGIGTIDGTPGGLPSVIIGNGGFNIEAIVDSWNDNFLNLTSIGVLPGQFRTTLITSTLELPFGPGGVAALLEQVGGPNVVPALGGFNGGSGPDFLMEADSNQTFKLFDASVPEPATMMLGLMGLAGLAVRRNRASA